MNTSKLSAEGAEWVNNNVSMSWNCDGRIHAVSWVSQHLMRTRSNSCYRELWCKGCESILVYSKTPGSVTGSSYEPRRYKWCRRWVLCDRRSAGTLRVGFCRLSWLRVSLATCTMNAVYSCSESCLLLLLHWGGFVTRAVRGRERMEIYLSLQRKMCRTTWLTYSLVSFSSSTFYGRCFDPFLRRRTLSLTDMHREMQPRSFVEILYSI